MKYQKNPYSLIYHKITISNSFSSLSFSLISFTLTLKLFSLSIILTLKNRAFFAFSKRKEILSIIEYELVYCFFIVIFIGLNEEIFNHPNVMKKAQKDIDFVVGKNTQMLKRN